ncbi:MAG: MATE family efflux transporter [Pseudomonadota bacterium]
MNTLNSKILRIAWPAVVANISVPLLGLVDAALLGHLSDPSHLAGVAIGTAALSFFYWGFSFLRMGTTGEVARTLGAGNLQDALDSLCRSGVVAGVIALFLLVFAHPLAQLGVLLMNPEETSGLLAQRYMEIRFLSAPAVLTTYVIVGWFIGSQNTRWPLVVLLTTNLLNIVLDAHFILDRGMASEGAALATVIAEYVGLAVAILGLGGEKLRLLAQRLGSNIRGANPYLRLLKANAEIMVRTLALLFAFAFFTAAGERLGTTVVAANAVMIQLLLFASFALDGFAYAAEGLAGQALGARRLQDFYEVTRQCGLWVGGSGFLISMIILFGYSSLFPLLSDISSVREVFDAQRVWLILLPLVAAPSYLLDGIFIGAGATRPMMICMLVSVLLVFLPCWFLTQDWGNHGLWLSFTVFNAMRGLTMGLAFWRISYQNRWIPSSL